MSTIEIKHISVSAFTGITTKLATLVQSQSWLHWCDHKVSYTGTITKLATLV